METAVIEMLKRSAAIPSLPQVAARFLEITQDPDFDYRDVVEVLSSDAGATGEILRLANSALFGVTRQVSSLPQALTLLGLRRIRSLVLSRYVVDSVDRNRSTRLDIHYYWRRSLSCGVLAGQLAAYVEPQLREEAFIAGLLADIGVVILDEAMPTDYGPASAEYRPNGEPLPAAEELTLVGVTHAQASALVLAHWQLPDVVCEAVKWHPWDLEAMQASPLARLVGAADLLGKYLCDAQPDVARAVEACRLIDAGLRPGPGVLAKILSVVEPLIREFADTLGVQVSSLDALPAMLGGLRDPSPAAALA
jgi:HD-like signal output (HDOD) protein